MLLARHYRDRLLREEDLQLLVSLPAEKLRARIEQSVARMMDDEGKTLPQTDRVRLVRFLINEATGYGPLDKLMLDPSITEIMVNGPQEIFVEQSGQLRRRTDVEFNDEAHILHIIDRIVSPLGRRIDESNPWVDARLRDGSRVNAIIPPLSLNGPVLTIRRFRKTPFSIEDLVANDTLNWDMADFLKACVIAKQNIIVSGGTGSGKTTTLNVLATFIPERERIITIEDSAELQFHLVHPHVLRQESRPANVEGKGEVPIRQLVRNALRMRPDRIIVGEVRHAEALDMLQAMNTGHEGSMSTVHANSPRDAFARLETMVLWASSDLPQPVIREQLVGALNIIIQQERLSDGSRRIVSIAEVQGVRKGEIVLKDIFVWQRIGVDPETGKVEGRYTPTGFRPHCLPKVKAAGVRLAPDMFEPAYLVAEMGTQLLYSSDITEIMVNGPNEVYVEERGQLQRRSDIRFRDEAHLLGVINSIVAPLGRRVDETSPMVDGRLPDGSRVNAILPPIALNGPVLTIRRFPEVPLEANDLLKNSTLNEVMVEFLRSCVQAKLNVLISGGTGSGKTTTLNILSSFIPVKDRIITIEDTAELQLQQPHVIRQETRPADQFSEGAVSMRDLVRNALRMRPDRIIVGEVRGAEALDMLQAMNTGHEGSLTTIHANSSQDAFSRLETMVMWAGTQLPSQAIREQIVGAIHIIVQQQRMPTGERKIVAISEVMGMQGAAIRCQEIFAYRMGQAVRTGEKVEFVGSHEATGQVPRCLDRLQAYGSKMTHSDFAAPPASPEEETR